MNTLQLSKDLSVRQIAAIIKRLSQDDRDKLLNLAWDYFYEVPREVHERVAEKIRKYEEDSSRMIPLDEAMKRLRSKS